MVIRALIGMLALLIAVPPVARSQEFSLVEVVLVDWLDEPRGYCLDVLGNQANATPERGLHAHTCYSYQGQLGVDQAYHAEQLAVGEFQLPGFTVCMVAAELWAGSRLGLTACADAADQRFDLLATGQIVARAAPNLCLTVADGVGTPGGGGRPVHLLRPLTLEPCAAARSMYQTWRLRSQAD